MLSDGHTYINIDAQHIKASSPRLLMATIESPEDMLLLWDDGINRIAAEQADLLEELGLDAPPDKMQVRDNSSSSSSVGHCLCCCPQLAGAGAGSCLFPSSATWSADDVF